MRLLLFNPNTDAALTRDLSAVVARSLGPGDRLEIATAASGPDFINSEESITFARHHLEEALPAAAARADAVLLGCFGDLGIDHVRRKLGKPVLSLWDTCVTLAHEGSERVGILTTSRFWVDRLKHDIDRVDLAGRITTVSVLEDRSSPDRATLGAALSAGIAQMRMGGQVDKVVLGGARFAALPVHPARGGLPVINLLHNAVLQCRQAMRN